MKASITKEKEENESKRERVRMLIGASRGAMEQLPDIDLDMLRERYLAWKQGKHLCGWAWTSSTLTCSPTGVPRSRTVTRASGSTSG